MELYERNPNVSFTNKTPSLTIRHLHNEKANIMTKAVKIAYGDVIHKAESLKTETGKKNRVIKFFDMLHSNMQSFPLETQDYIQNLIKNSPLSSNSDGKPKTSNQLLTSMPIHPDIQDLLWIGDGPYKNYEYKDSIMSEIVVGNTSLQYLTRSIVPRNPLLQYVYNGT